MFAWAARFAPRISWFAPAPSPAAAAAPAATSLLSFWQELPNVSYVSDSASSCTVTLVLGNNQCWMNDTHFGNTLILRECYRKLSEKVVAGWCSNIPLDFLILGSPGIGKTCFLYYMLSLLAVNVVGELNIVFQSPSNASGSGKRILFRRSVDGVYSVVEGSLTKFENLLKLPKTIYLVDDMEPSFLERRACTLEVCCANNPVHYKQYRKEDGTKVLFMPIWSYLELLSARKNIFTNVTLKRLKHAFAQVGGIIRNVLAKPNWDPEFNTDAIIQKAVNGWHSDAAKVLETHGGKRDEVCDVVLHYIVDEDTYASAKYDFASPFIVKQFRLTHERALGKYFSDTIRHAKGRGGSVYFRALAARLFEDYAVEKLLGGGRFQIKKAVSYALGCRCRKQYLTLPTLEPTDFVPIDDEKSDILALAAKKFGVPSIANFPVIDALCKGNTANGVPNALFFQMRNPNTVSTGEGAKKCKITHLLRLLSYIPAAELPVRLIQVVPEMNFAAATPLRFEKDDGSAGDIPAGCEEWILSLPVDGLVEKANKKQRTA